MTQLTQQTSRDLLFKTMTFNNLTMSAATTKRENFSTMLRILFQTITEALSTKNLFIIL